MPLSRTAIEQLWAIEGPPAHIPEIWRDRWLHEQSPFLNRGQAMVLVVGDRAGWLVSHDPGVTDEPFVAFSCLRIAPDCQGEERVQVLGSLLDATRGWARGRGVARLLGPIMLTTWLPYRVLDRDRGPLPFPFPGETVEPRERQIDYQAMGFKVTDRFVSRYLHKRNPPWWLMDLLEKWLRRGMRVSIRVFGSEELPARMGEVYRMVAATFARNAHFAPIDPAEFAMLMAATGPLEAIHLGAFDPSGQLVGFCTGYIHGEVGILKTVGVVPEHRGTRLGMGLTYQFHRELLARGLGQAVHALMKDDNASNKMSARVAKSMREYVLYGCSVD